MPWDGSPHPAEQQNQPLSIEVSVLYGTKPGNCGTMAAIEARVAAPRGTEPVATSPVEPAPVLAPESSEPAQVP